MNKRQIFDAFDGKISRTAIRQFDGKWRIMGKGVEIEYLGGGIWDVFCCDRENSLGTARVNNVLAKFSSVGIPVVKLNGEGYTQGSIEQIKPVVLSCLRFFGIRKKRELSPEQLENMRLNLSN